MTPEQRYRELEATWREVTRLIGVSKPSEVMPALRRLATEHRRLTRDVR